MANLIPYLIYLIMIFLMGWVIVGLFLGVAGLVEQAHPPLAARPWLLMSVLSANLASLGYATYLPASSSILIIGGSPEQYLRGWPMTWYGYQGLGSFLWVFVLFGDLFFWIISIGVLYRGSTWLMHRYVPTTVHRRCGVLSWLIVTVSAAVLPFVIPPFF